MASPAGRELWEIRAVLDKDFSHKGLPRGCEASYSMETWGKKGKLDRHSRLGVLHVLIYRVLSFSEVP